MFTFNTLSPWTFQTLFSPFSALTYVLIHSTPFHSFLLHYFVLLSLNQWSLTLSSFSRSPTLFSPCYSRQDRSLCRSAGSHWVCYRRSWCSRGDPGRTTAKTHNSHNRPYYVLLKFRWKHPDCFESASAVLNNFTLIYYK